MTIPQTSKKELLEKGLDSLINIQEADLLQDSLRPAINLLRNKISSLQGENRQ